MYKKTLRLLLSRVALVLGLLGSVGCVTAMDTLLDEYHHLEGELCDPLGGAPRESIDDVFVEPPVVEGQPRPTGTVVLEDGGSAIAARGWLTEMAERTIDIQYFIFSSDKVGLIAADFMLRAAQRGVKVRLIVDDLLVDGDAEFLAALDAHPNITIRVYNPNINIGKSMPGRFYSAITDFRGVNQRMHNKTFIVDGRVVITGGRNVADEYYDYNEEYNFRDRDVLLVGGVVEKVQASFEEYWDHPLVVSIKPLASETVPGRVEAAWEGLHRYACDDDIYWPQARKQLGAFPTLYRNWEEFGGIRWLDDVDFVWDTPGKNTSKGMWGGGKTTTALMDLIKGAKKSVVIQTPYLVTSGLGQGLFASAIKRGVSVTILTNSLGATDNLMAFNGYRRNRDDLLRMGVKLYEFRPDAAIRRSIMTSSLAQEVETFPVFGLHAKTLVVDDDVVVVTTFNLDPRSANLNTECMTVIRSKEVAGEVLNEIGEELKPENAWRTTLHWDPDARASWYKRFMLLWFGVLPKSIL
ncbi:MAG: phospholipase D family protein [Myxococcota bacterium]|nr:phospholipase D family protein [Myxococcota bacterium]